MDTLCDKIIHAVCLEATLIADEDHLAATILQLFQARHRNPDIYDAPTCPEVVHRRLLPVLCLERGHVVHAFHWTPIQHIYNNTHSFALEPVGKALGLKHAPGSCHHHVILTLDDVVLLWVVGRCVLTMHTLNHAVLRKLPHGELTVTVSADCPQLQAGLAFRSHLDLLDSSRLHDIWRGSRLPTCTC
jgi:hypothetical protein